MVVSKQQLAIAHKVRAHSPVGGSSAKRVMNCTASVMLSQRYPNIESEFAAEGTAKHEATDLIFQGRTEQDSDVIGLRFNDIVITEEMFEDAIQKGLKQWDAIDKELGGIEYYNEAKVIFPDLPVPVLDEDGNPTGEFDHEGAFGLVDIVGRAKDRAIVWDWKYGSGVAVEAEYNEQLMYYAYAAANTPGTAELFDRHKPIELFICQPSVNDGEPFTRWVTTYMQLEAFALEYRRKVEEAYSPEATFKLGSWCKFCNAKPGCPLYNNVAEKVVGIDRERLREELSSLLPMADLAIEFGEAIKAMAHAEMERGVQVHPDYKLVNKRAYRYWVDEEKALKFMARMKLPAEKRYKKKLLSPAQAEEALKPLGVAELPKDLVEKRSSGTTLAHISDKRPAVMLPGDMLKELADRLAAG